MATSPLKRDIRRASFVAAGIAAVLSPIPLADEIALLPVFAILAVRAGKRHGLRPSAVPWKHVAKTTALGLGARATANLAVAAIPVVAAIANATSAVILTQLLGRDYDAACEAIVSGVPVGSNTNGVHVAAVTARAPSPV